jgi:outer membrane protein assembly factor BamB
MRVASVFGMAFIAAVAWNTPAEAQSTVILTPASGHPSLAVTLAGTGFGDSEAVNVYVDTVDTLLLVSTSTGTFSVSLTIPAAAQPGEHYVTTIGRRSGAAAQAAFTVTTPWKEYGYGVAHLGWNPYENTLNTSNVSSLGPLWSVSVFNQSGSSTPTVSAGRVYLSGSGIEAFSAATGSLLWQKFTRYSVTGSAAVIANVLYVADAYDYIYALNATTGAQIWRKALGNPIYLSTVVVDGVMYVASFNGEVYAVNAATGAILWKTLVGTGSVGIESAPAVVNGVLYTGAQDGNVYALDAATGAIMWHYLTGGAVAGAPAVAGGVVYVSAMNGVVYAIKATGPHTGALLWSSTTGNTGFATAAVAYGEVFVGSGSASLVAFDAHSGALRWSAPTGGAMVNEAVANGIVYGVSDDTLYAIDASDGAVLATMITGATSGLSGPAVSDGVLYLLTPGGNLSAFSIAAGADARPPAHAPALAMLHPNMSLAITSQRNNVRANPDEE